MKNILLIIIGLFTTDLLFAQCPANINFASGDLSSWSAYTNNFASNSSNLIYPANTPAPAGTTGAITINEFNTFNIGIQANTVNGIDQFGFFQTIPTINGYNYNYSVLLGSTTITTRNSNLRGGYLRGLSYIINVPPGSATVPYTVTYAYAMVLENGSHTTSSQPIFTATVTSPAGKIECASAKYNLPTKFVGIQTNANGQRDSIFVIDDDFARQEGFSLSPIPSPNDNGNQNESTQRVYTKGWTEVTFNLAPFRGQQVTLTFEADNCVPGGHFAYAYIALRNDCGGLEISGPDPACTNAPAEYSIPSLANANYTWTIPAGWQIVSSNNNIITVKPGNAGGAISVIADNGCTNLQSVLNVAVSPPTVAGAVTPDLSVCSGTNSSIVNLTGNVGQVVKWLSSTDGINFNDIGNANATTYTAVNLNKTTYYKAVVQNGSVCTIDTSTAATVTVFDKSVGGAINPSDFNVCLNQDKGADLFITGKTGSVVNWQWSDDNSVWNNFAPVYADSVYSIVNQIAPVRYYRAVVQNGVCPADFSAPSKVTLINVQFPKALISPVDTTICYGDTARLTTTIQTGTTYQWLNTNDLFDPNNNKVPSNPYSFTAFASPLLSTEYPISISNNGCPNPLLDTFTVNVRPPISLSTGNDTFIVVGQPLQLIAQVIDPSQYSFIWSPSTGLSNTIIYNPIANLGSTIDSITYKVIVTDNIAGCTEKSSIKVKVFKTGPQLFVPNAFTPNNDQLNDVLKPIAVGISKLVYFKVYNRWGQQLYSTVSAGKGWDGTLNGREQPSGVYVWVAEAVTYTGVTITQKGTATLIR
ncbi:MAG: gliding motility-associated C-terminal domain-containing protein [Sphingobacteriales bacterium]